MKRPLKVMLWLLAAPVALGLLFHAEEYVRGRYLWERHLRGLAARGDSLDIRKYIPPPIPDDQNMAAAPIFAEFFSTNRPIKARLFNLQIPYAWSNYTAGWRAGSRPDLNLWRAALSNEGLLAALAVYEPIMKEVEAAAQRPQARFPLHYEEGAVMADFHATSLLKLAKLYRLKALAELEAGATEAAFADITLIIRLSQALSREPVLLSLQCRGSMLQVAMLPFWEGAIEHRWNPEQLLQLQQDFTKAALFKQMDLVLRGKRCEILWWESDLLSNLSSWLGDIHLTYVKRNRLAFLVPKGWIYINCLNLDRSYLKYILPCLDSRGQRFHPDRLGGFAVDSNPRCITDVPYHYLEAILLSGMALDLARIAYAQTAVQQAMTACALERYRLARGRFPEKLDELVPQYLAAVPKDVIDGQPLRYRREGAKGFVLYSIGWNMKDDGGEVAWMKTFFANETPRLDDKAGDWVWRSQPAAP